MCFLFLFSQVTELLEWEEQTQQKFPNSNQSVKEIDTAAENNPLKRFSHYCDKSKSLLHIFRIDIYRPLCDYFSDNDDDIREVPKSLEKVVQKWEALLHFSPLNEKLFNSVTCSRDKLINTSFRLNRVNETDLVVRLVPDLYQKKFEVLRLANKWRLISKAKVTQRRGTYTLSPNTLKKREVMPRLRMHGVSQELINQNYGQIQSELAKTRLRYDETSQELRATQEKCIRYEGEMEFCKTECANLREQLQHTAELRKAIEMKVCDSYSSSGTILVEENNNDITLWEKELERIKTKYSRQKLKFLNARKQIETLNNQLEILQGRCSHLQSKIDNDSHMCRSLEKQLEVARKNIQTQGNMVDALQHQCYTLKQELDTSNVKKGELYTQLNNTIERCKTFEKDLTQTRVKFKELVDENGRRKSHEEELERENVQLRKFIEQNGMRRRSNEANSLPPNDSTHWKYASTFPSRNIMEITRPISPNKGKECMFPDINAGRSF